MANAHDLVLHLRCHAPHLARRLDFVRGLGLSRGVLTVRVADDSWCRGELQKATPQLEGAASQLCGEPVRLVLETRPPAEETLPLAVTSTKFWNHAVFLAALPGELRMAAVPKPVYRERWLPAAAAGASPPAGELARGAKVRLLRYPAADPAAALPALVDDLAALAREHRSYAQLLLAFPGDPVAERLEARLYGIKDWGTPRTPGPILQKYVGRLHYLPPAARHLGLRIAAGAP